MKVLDGHWNTRRGANSKIKLSGGLQFKANRIGFNILLYNNFNSVTTSTLANEAGDVMAYMEYSEAVIADFNARRIGYRNKISTRYSDAVQNAHGLISNGKLPKQGVFPLKITGKSFVTQNGNTIKE